MKRKSTEKKRIFLIAPNDTIEPLKAERMQKNVNYLNDVKFSLLSIIPEVFLTLKSNRSGFEFK